MFSSLLKLSLLWGLNVLFVSFAASRVHLNLPLIPEVCHVWATSVLLSRGMSRWVLEASRSITYQNSLVAAGWGFLFPHQEEVYIFTFSPEVLGPLKPKDGSVQASLCISISRVILTFSLGTDPDTCCHHGWPTGRCSTFKAVLSLLFVFFCQVKKRNWYLFSEPLFFPLHVKYWSLMFQTCKINFSILPTFICWGICKALLWEFSRIPYLSIGSK